jgi:uncharacterized protein YcbK (DUF882 family)
MENSKALLLSAGSDQLQMCSPVCPTVHRRDVLKIGLAGLLATVIPFVTTRKAMAAIDGGVWKVSMKHAHTGETFSGAYRVGDKYLPEAFERLNVVLRDFRTHEVFPMDPRVLDIVSLVQAKTKTGRPLEVLSGYRSPKTNNMLRHESRGVAKNSFHMYGQAMDIRMDDFNTGRLRRIAMDIHAGGVGYYPRSDFVHVDTGKFRTW